MSVTTSHLMQVANKNRAKLEEFLHSFKSKTAFANCCRCYESLRGYEPEIAAGAQGWFVSTFAFNGVNVDLQKLNGVFDESFVVQAGTIDDRTCFSTVHHPDEQAFEERASAVDCLFDAM